MAASKLSVGNAEILVLHDNESALPLSMTFPDVSAGAWATWATYQQRYPEGLKGRKTCVYISNAIWSGPRVRQFWWILGWAAMPPIQAAWQPLAVGWTATSSPNYRLLEYVRKT